MSHYYHHPSNSTSSLSSSSTNDIEELVRDLYQADYETPEFQLQPVETTNSQIKQLEEEEEEGSPWADMDQKKFRNMVGSQTQIEVDASNNLEFTPVKLEAIRLDQNQTITLRKSDYAYRNDTWDGAPIVVEEFRLLFFSVPKVGCTVFKQLFRRMMGYDDWNQQNGRIPHSPVYNGLRYLWHYPEKQAREMLLSSRWTKAIFVRDPKERILSAYLDKGRNQNGRYLMAHCCPKRRKCHKRASGSFQYFVELTAVCRDPHWNPQTWRMEGKYWAHLNFVGYLDFIRTDTERLLRSIGAWERHGKSGWGSDGTESIFASVATIRHKTNSHDKLHQFYTTNPAIETMVEKLYEDDYRNPLCNFTKYRITKSVHHRL